MTLLSHPAVVALFALFVWWFSTGIVLYLVGWRLRASRRSLLGAAVLFAAALYGLALSSANTRVIGAYTAFACALLVWGTQEFAFLSGAITGPNNQPCAEGCSGWNKVALAVRSIVYHEIALVLSGVAVIGATWNSDNPFGAWTFLILWAMRLSAKINLFLGVPVLNQEFLPDRLSYLASFFSKGPVSTFFPFAVTVATAVTTLLVAQALSSDATAFARTGYMLLASLLALGVLEHWFMVLPLPISALWGWGMRSRSVSACPSPAASLSVDVGVRSVVSKIEGPR
jgi:putative photosynthetic complex assembly protein 2